MIAVLMWVEDPSVPERIVRHKQPATPDTPRYCLEHCRIAVLVDIIKDEIELARCLCQSRECIADMDANAVR